MANKRILVAPLNWGLGHATRCIPILHALRNRGFEPIVASDGEALSLLQHEFPKLTFETLPAYNITYSKTKMGFSWAIAKQLPKLKQTIKKGYKQTQHLVEKYKIEGIISDNRLGVRCPDITSVIITHQLKVLSKNVWLSSKLHQHYIQLFNACWVPDFKDTPNLSGVLGHTDVSGVDVTYINPLSRFSTRPITEDIDLLCILSGPEPQRTLLEQKLRTELSNYKGTVVLVQGLVSDTQTAATQEQFTVYNYMTSELLETYINRAKLVIARSGYTTLMDLAALGKRAFFIPTPGQLEQTYLAKQLTEANIAGHCSQDDFNTDCILEAYRYSGFSKMDYNNNFDDLFRLF